jgi:hypothetical protein
MRMPEFETLNTKDCPQKGHRPVVNGFLKRLGLLFTKELFASLEEINSRTLEKPDNF